MTISKRIEKARKTKYWSQLELANASGIDIQDIVRVEESGEADICTIQNIALALNCSLKWIVEGDNSSYEQYHPTTLQHHESLTKLSKLEHFLCKQVHTAEELGEIHLFFEDCAAEHGKSPKKNGH